MEIYDIAFWLVVGWFAGLIIFFVLLAKKYTFGHWTKEHPNPYQLETFGMPRGAFRGAMTLSLLFIVLLLEVINLHQPLFFQESGKQILFLPETRYKELMIAFQMLLAFYFGSKMFHHLTRADERKSGKIAETATQLQPQPRNVQTTEFDEEGAVG